MRRRWGRSEGRIRRVRRGDQPGSGEVHKLTHVLHVEIEGGRRWKWWRRVWCGRRMRRRRQSRKRWIERRRRRFVYHVVRHKQLSGQGVASRAQSDRVYGVAKRLLHRERDATKSLECDLCRRRWRTRRWWGPGRRRRWRQRWWRRSWRRLLEVGFAHETEHGAYELSRGHETLESQPRRVHCAAALVRVSDVAFGSKIGKLRVGTSVLYTPAREGWKRLSLVHSGKRRIGRRIRAGSALRRTFRRCTSRCDIVVTLQRRSSVLVVGDQHSAGPHLHIKVEAALTRKLGKIVVVFRRPVLQWIRGRSRGWFLKPEFAHPQLVRVGHGRARLENVGHWRVLLWIPPPVADVLVGPVLRDREHEKAHELGVSGQDVWLKSHVLRMLIGVQEVGFETTRRRVPKLA